MGYDGTLVHNIMKHSVKIQPYRADGLAAETWSPEIGPGEWRLINNDHIGDADCFFIVAFMHDSEIPERIGVTQAMSAGSGSIGFSYLGTGISLGGGGGGTDYYSSSMAAAVVKLTQNPKTGRFESNEKFLLKAAYGTVSFNPGETSDKETHRGEMIVWQLAYAPDQKSRPSDKDLKGW